MNIILIVTFYKCKHVTQLVQNIEKVLYTLRLAYETCDIPSAIYFKNIVYYNT